jgi:hypothetical protein
MDGAGLVAPASRRWFCVVRHLQKIAGGTPAPQSPLSKAKHGAPIQWPEALSEIRTDGYLLLLGVLQMLSCPIIPEE